MDNLINRIFKNVAGLGSLMLPTSKLIKISGQPVFFPFYHAITNTREPHLAHLNVTRSIDQFKRDLEYLLKYLEPINQDELINSNIKKPSFLLTFDDGLSEFYDVARPILLAKGIPCTVFVNSAFVDNKRLFYRFKASILVEKTKDKSHLLLDYSHRKELDERAQKLGVDFKEYLETKKPYMSLDQLKELVKDGFSVGAHSIDHPRFNSIPVAEQKRQIKESINFIEEQLGITQKTFAFPFDDLGVTKEIYNDIEDIALYFGTSGINTGSVLNSYQRTVIEGKGEMNRIIRNEYAYYIIKKRIFKFSV